MHFTLPHGHINVCITEVMILLVEVDKDYLNPLITQWSDPDVIENHEEHQASQRNPGKTIGSNPIVLPLKVKEES